MVPLTAGFVLLAGCRAGYDGTQLQGTVDVLAGVDGVALDGAGDAAGSGDLGVADGAAPDVGPRRDGVGVDLEPPGPPVCGDGSINQAREGCDDGNTTPGDGCSPECAVEDGWVCDKAPSECRPICGDGIIIRVPSDPAPEEGPVAQAGLPCDDGNSVGGDGCDETCHTERGWTCEPAAGFGGEARTVEGPSYCHGTCGDGFVTADEECDDGNLTVPVAEGGSGVDPGEWEDGCDHTCHVVDGWRCSRDTDGASVCSTDCGDGWVLEPYEACDDGNGEPGDGCDQSCQVEEHWECAPVGLGGCWPICGDGYAVMGLELCDDGDANGAPGDGCSAKCTPVEGWTCDPVDGPDGVTVCEPICGDGKIVGPEECDDGPDGSNNPWSGPEDGCDVCEPTDGWTCDPVAAASSGGHACKPWCGDGTVISSVPTDLAGVTAEQCDDGNNDPGDGCSPTCAVEMGWGCGHLPGGASQCHAAKCGDGLWVGAEGCDDGNDDPGDGCSPTCTVEPGWKCAGVPVETLDQTPAKKSACAFWCLDEDGDGYGVGPHCAEVEPDCDDTSADAHPGGEEVCDGLDNDCDGLTDAKPCGGSDVGVCQKGVSYCTASDASGSFGPCVGKIGPAAVELCNGLDDTCDGHTDAIEQGDGSFAPPTQTCGYGECANEVSACAGGELQVCEPNWGKAKDHETCGNDQDDDCDGLTDEGCAAGSDEPGCVWVVAGGMTGLGPGEQGSLQSPFQDLQAAIASAGSRDVCILAPKECQPSDIPLFILFDGEPEALSGDVEMQAGVSVLGGFVWKDSGPVQQAGCESPLVVSGPLGVHFQGITAPTMLQGVRVVSVYDPSIQGMGGGGMGGDGWVGAVTIDESPGAVVAESWISGSPSAPLSAGVLVRGGVDDANEGPLLRGNRILGGGTEQSAGVRSEGARPRVDGSCDRDLMKDGRCAGTCDPTDPAPFSDRFVLGGLPALDPNATPAQTAVGVWLVDSPGARVAASVVCAFGSDTAEGVRVEGVAAGTVVQTSSVFAAGGSTQDVGVHAQGCGGTRPRLVGNTVLGAAHPAGSAPSGSSFGVWLQAGCHGVVEGNQLIAGLMGGGGALAVGVYCDPTDPTGAAGEAPGCLISRNLSIVGHAGEDLLDASASPLVTESYGVRCGAASCRGIVQNGVVAGGAAARARGVSLDQSAGLLLDSNLIWPGCATDKAYGIDASSALARVQNNFVVTTGEGCLGTDLQDHHTTWLGLRATTGAGAAPEAELDLHSNVFYAAGHLAQAANCQAAAVSMSNPKGPRGVYRNNILGAGGCQASATVAAAEKNGGPRYLGYNDLAPDAPVAYWNVGTGQTSASAADLDASNPPEGPVRFEHNLSVPVVFNDQAPQQGVPQPPALDPDSPLVDHGTGAGAPKWDIQGDPRPAGEGFDIGADEVH